MNRRWSFFMNSVQRTVESKKPRMDRGAGKWCAADLHGKRIKILTPFILRFSTRRVLERSTVKSPGRRGATGQ